MKMRSTLLALAAAGVVAGATACALDFNQFEPVDGSAPPNARDSSKEPPGSDAEAPPTTDAGGSDDATIDVAEPQDAGPGDASATGDGGGRDAESCTPSQSCLMTAQMCAMMCATQEQMCSSRCSSGGCRAQCRGTQSMCNSQCQNTCTSCTQSAGCSASAACADAG
jgi:hypothetical protein